MRIMPSNKKFQHGDTIVEVMISLAVFSAVAMSTINMMNGGINMAQRSLEMTMARQAINSQIDALEYIHDAAFSERKTGKANKLYSDIWNDKIIENPIDDTVSGGATTDLNKLDINEYATCHDAITNKYDKAFALNPRAILPVYYDNQSVEYIGNSGRDIIKYKIYQGQSMIREGGLYPRIIFKPLNNTSNNDLYDNTLITDTQTRYRDVEAVENLWITAVKEEGYYDFYIQSCWHSAGSENFTTFSTVKRFYDGDTL